MVASTLPEVKLSLDMQECVDHALQDAVETFPQDHAKLAKAYDLVLNDAVIDFRAVTPGHWEVGSGTTKGLAYQVWVWSKKDQTCSCPDYQTHYYVTHPYYCKHIWAVFLLIKAQKLLHAPRKRHGYHLVSGDEGHVRELAEGRVEFFPGGHKYSFVCQAAEVQLGPYLPR